MLLACTVCVFIKYSCTVGRCESCALSVYYLCSAAVGRCE